MTTRRNVTGIRTFEYALLDEAGSVEESRDTSFKNRAVEVTLTSEAGTIERRIHFPDHPALTKGIHPALLPVARLAGTDASNSRLAACDAVEIPGAENNRILICPDAENPGSLTVYTWEHESDALNVQSIDSLPAEITLGDARVNLRDHRTHARSVVKWRRADRGEDVAGGDTPGDFEAAPSKKAEQGDTTKALVISWIDDDGHQKAVLPLDRPTPVRIGGFFQTFRYRNAL